MSYSFLADAILVFHFSFILFVIFGALLALRNYRWIYLHIPVFIWGAVVNLMSWICPLTPLEVEYRYKAGEDIYQGGFIQHYIGSVVYPQGLGEHAGFILGLSALIWNGLIYFLVFTTYKKNRKKPYTNL